MLRLDILGLLLTLFFLGPKHWRWSLAAAGVALVATLLFLIVWQTDLIAYTMGGLFSQLELNNNSFTGLLAGLVGPFACYAVAKFIAWRPMGKTGWLKQLLPWSELENPRAGTFAKYAILSVLFALVKLLS